MCTPWQKTVPGKKVFTLQKDNADVCGLQNNLVRSPCPTSGCRTVGRVKPLDWELFTGFDKEKGLHYRKKGSFPSHFSPKTFFLHMMDNWDEKKKCFRRRVTFFFIPFLFLQGKHGALNVIHLAAKYSLMPHLWSCGVWHVCTCPHHIWMQFIHMYLHKYVQYNK